MKKQKKAMVFTSAFLLLLVTCKPLTNDVLVIAEDTFLPSIIVTDPVGSSVYYSVISVKGRVYDDALKVGDDLGRLKSLSFASAADHEHRGRITISPEGKVTQDTSYGNKRITYDPPSRNFSFSIKTNDLGYSPSTINLVIEATDYNENLTKKTLTFDKNDGPYIELTEPSEENFYYGKLDNISFKGLLADSAEVHVMGGDSVSAGEIEKLRLTVPELSVDVALNIAQGETQKSFPGYRNASILTYDPSKREFSTRIELLEADNNYPSMNFRFEVFDKNGNSSLVNRYGLQNNMLQPIIKVSEPKEDGKRFFYSSQQDTFCVIDKNGALTTATAFETEGEVWSSTKGIKLVSARIELQDTHGIQIPNTPQIDILNLNSEKYNTGADLFYYSFNNISFSKSDFETAEGPVNVTYIAENGNSEVGQSKKTIRVEDDSQGPIFEEIELNSANQNYIKRDDTLTISFRVSDGSGAGLNTKSIQGSVAGIALSQNDFIKNKDGKWQIDVTLNQPTQKNGPLEISIEAQDYLNNLNTLTQADIPSRTFIEGKPEVDPDSISFTTASGDIFATSDEEIKLTFRTTQPLKKAPKVEIGGNDASVTGSHQDWTATTSNPINGQVDVSYAITDIVNVFDTSGGEVPITESNIKYYPGKPKVDPGSISFTTNSNDLFATPDEEIKLTFRTTQPLKKAPTVEIGGNNASVTGSHQNWTATTSNPINGQVDVSYAISDIVNVAGTPGEDVPTTVSNIKYYPGRPEVAPDSFTTASGDIFAISDEEIKLTFRTTQPLKKAPKVEIGGNNASVAGIHQNWTATTSNPSSGQGDVSYAITDIVNLAGTSGDDVKNNGIVYYPGAGIFFNVSTRVNMSGKAIAAGDEIEVKFEVNPLYVINGSPNVVFEIGTGNSQAAIKDGTVNAPNYRYTYLLEATDLITRVGKIIVKITVTNSTGNKGETTNNLEVFF